MCALRQVPMMCAVTLALAACTRPAPEPAASVNDSAAAEPSIPARPSPEPTTTEPAAADSSLAIKRGIAMLAHDRMTFRPCREKAELWILDQTDGVLTQAFAAETQGGPTMLYIEAYGERAPVAEDVPEARVYAGTFVLEEVLYAGVEGEVRGCQAPPQDYVVAARGSEPFWLVEVRQDAMIWRQPNDPKEIMLGAPQTENVEGAARYHARTGEHELYLMIDAQACRDPMSGEFFAYSAKALLDGKEFTGCARVGG